jgi:hypothetical protein
MLVGPLLGIQHFTEHWQNQVSVDLQALYTESPPSMANDLADHLFGAFLNDIPIFNGLGPEIIMALCLKCKTVAILSGHTIMAEGEPGREMYVHHPWLNGRRPVLYWS